MVPGNRFNMLLGSPACNPAPSHKNPRSPLPPYPTLHLHVAAFPHNLETMSVHSPESPSQRSVSGTLNWSREVAARTEEMEAQIAELEAQSARLVSPTIGSRASTAAARHEGSVALSFDLASPLVGSVGHGTKLLSTHEHLEQLMRNLTCAELCQAHPRTSRSARHLTSASVALAHTRRARCEPRRPVCHQRRARGGAMCTCRSATHGAWWYA